METALPVRRAATAHPRDTSLGGNGGGSGPEARAVALQPAVPVPLSRQGRVWDAVERPHTRGKAQGKETRQKVSSIYYVFIREIYEKNKYMQNMGLFFVVSGPDFFLFVQRENLYPLKKRENLYIHAKKNRENLYVSM